MKRRSRSFVWLSAEHCTYDEAPALRGNDIAITEPSRADTSPNRELKVPAVHSSEAEVLRVLAKSL